MADIKHKLDHFLNVALQPNAFIFSLLFLLYITCWMNMVFNICLENSKCIYSKIFKQTWSLCVPPQCCICGIYHHFQLLHQETLRKARNWTFCRWIAKEDLARTWIKCIMWMNTLVSRWDNGEVSKIAKRVHVKFQTVYTDVKTASCFVAKTTLL